MKLFLKKAFWVCRLYTCRFKTASLTIVLCLLNACLLCACTAAVPQRYESTDTAMGTIIRQNIYAKEDGKQVTQEVMEVIDSLETEILSWRIPSSQVSQVNKQAGAEEGSPLSEELSQILEMVWQVSEDSAGALDVTIGEVTRLWDIDGFVSSSEDEAFFRIPEQEQIDRALEHTGYDMVKLFHDRIILPEDMELDLGAVGKGAACDAILAYLEQQEQVTGAVISVGGSILTYGEKQDHTAWNIGIVDPFDTSSCIGSLILSGQWCISTSGDYERYVEKDGIRYHHIMDPATGCPADSGLSSVTVLSKNGCLSDALSTACFVLGKERSLALLEKYEAHAVFVGQDGSISTTPGMEEYFR